jgi:hypothetical protein
MSRYLVFDSEGAARAAQDLVWSRILTDYAGKGAAHDGAGGLLSKTAGQIDATAQRTVAWAGPRQRLDGRWAFAHPETQNEAAKDAALLAALVKDLAPVAIEAEDPDWWPDED